jgi:hypothetical protein
VISSRGGCQMQYCLLGRRSWASSSTLARLGSYVGPILAARIRRRYDSICFPKGTAHGGGGRNAVAGVIMMQFLPFAPKNGSFVENKASGTPDRGQL